MIDQLIEEIVNSPDRAAIAAGARLLDRYLRHQQFVANAYVLCAVNTSFARKLPAAPLRCLRTSLAGSLVC